MEKEIVIKVENVGMTFRIVNNKTKSAKNYLIERAKNKISYKEFKALEAINFETYKGKVVGLIGLNGAGKIQDIIDFVGIRDFIYNPVNNYSSGMKARLG